MNRVSANLENGGSVGNSKGHGDVMDDACAREEGNGFNEDQAYSRGVNGLGGSHERRGGEEGRPPQKRARDAKYAIPTMEEACLLRETEGSLFEGNVLRLEVEELLGEVRVDYGKRAVKALEGWLHTLKDALEDLPPSTVTEDSLGLEGIRLANHIPGKPVTLDFRPPKTDGFDVAGSFLLRALAKPSLNVDLSLRMPSSCLVPRDALNHRYLDKRALYAGHLAVAAMDKEGRLGKLVDGVEVSYFKGDPRKPVVLLHPSLGGAVSKRFTVRLLPCCGRDIMAPARLGPRRNNVRTRSALAQLASMENGEGGPTDSISTAGDPTFAGRSVRGEEVVSSLPATPRYNSAVLEDMCIKSHLAALHGLCRDSQAFRDAIILGKVWLGQHGMRTSHDSLGGYEWSMLLLHLAQSRRVNARMPALSIFQVALKFIADGGLSRDCLTVRATAPSKNHGHEGQALPLTPQEEEAFKEAFPAVMVDTTLGFNVLARISSSAVEELEMTAKASVSLFQGRPGAAFRRLFMTRTTLWRKCDAFVQIPLVPAKREREGEEGLLDRPLWSHVAQRVTELLREGLGDRCVLARPLCGAAGEATEDFQGVPGPRGWHPRSPPPPEGCFAHPSGGGVGGKRDREDLPRLTVGLIVDPAFAGRLVDKGPPAEDGPAARKFREFWGEKSELRRFKDGSIVEAVVWRGKGAQRHRVVEQIVRHVLARHDSSRCAKRSKSLGQGIRFRGNELLGMVAAAGTKGATEDDDLTRIAIRELDKLQERAKAIDGMPLRVEALQAASPSLRYTSLVPPAPHPLAISHGETRPSALFESGPSKPKKISSQVEPLEVVVRLEGSGKWPDEPEAVRSAETAFLIRLAQCLDKKYELKCVVARRYMDVMTGGYCFRLRIGGDRTLQMQLRSQNKGVNHNTIDLESLALREEGVLVAPHHSGMHGLHLQKPAFGLTVRAALRWLEEHMMSDHLRVEAVELLVASLFSDDGFSCWAGLASPSTTLVGFLRFLLLLSGHDWETAPLVVDPQGELTASDRAAAEEAFTRSRDRDPGGGDAMFIVAPYSRDFGWSSSWTRSRPERPLLGRLVALAKASAESLVEWLAGEGMLGRNPTGWKKAFRMTKEEEQTFDVTLSLNKAFVSDSSSSDPSVSAADPAEAAKAKVKSERQELTGSETFERRRVRGCPALQTKVYKNLLPVDGGAKKAAAAAEGRQAAKADSEFAAHGSVVVGFDPIGDLVSELRRRFGYLAVFFSPGPAGSTGKIGVIWRPSAFLPRPYNVTRSRYTMVVSAETVSEEGKGKGKRGAMAVLGAVEVLAEMKALAGDMLDGIHLS